MKSRGVCAASSRLLSGLATGATLTQLWLGTRRELADSPGSRKLTDLVSYRLVESPRVRLAAGTLDAIRGAGLSGLLFLAAPFWCRRLFGVRHSTAFSFFYDLIYVGAVCCKLRWTHAGRCLAFEGDGPVVPTSIAVLQEFPQSANRRTFFSADDRLVMGNRHHASCL